MSEPGDSPHRISFDGEFDDQAIQALRIPFDDEATQVLRRAACAAPLGLMSPSGLRAALEQAADTQLQQTVRVRGDSAVKAMVNRARSLAATRKATHVALADLWEALIEGEALAAGLNLHRLRIAQAWARRQHGGAPAKRA